MSTTLSPIFKKAYFTLAALGGLYLLFVYSLTFSSVQRFALYANRIDPALWQNLSDFESFGFHSNQVQPFTVRTPDNETLYAWHILPNHLVQTNKQELSRRNIEPRPASEQLESLSFRLLADPNAHIILNFHGNAAHLGSAHRPATYRSFLTLSSPSRPVHVIAFDYRGFGPSTGSPTEQGLTTDGETMLSFLTGLGSSTPQTTQNLSIPPSHISLTSQSLGTAVASALFHKWTTQQHLPPPALLLLTSPFSSFRSLIDVYSIFGILPPLLSPFRGHSGIMTFLTKSVIDPWKTDARILDVMKAPLMKPGREEGMGSRVRIEILHAQNDMEIPWWEGAKILSTVAHAIFPDAAGAGAEGGLKCPFERRVVYTPPSPDLEIDSELDSNTSRDGNQKAAKRVLRFTCLTSGGHDEIAGSQEVVNAVGRAMRGEDPWEGAAEGAEGAAEEDGYGDDSFRVSSSH